MSECQRFQYAGYATCQWIRRADAHLGSPGRRIGSDAQARGVQLRPSIMKNQTKRLETIGPDQLVAATGGASTTGDLWKMPARDGMLPWQTPRPPITTLGPLGPKGK